MQGPLPGGGKIRLLERFLALGTVQPVRVAGLRDGVLLIGAAFAVVSVCHSIRAVPTTPNTD